MDLNKFGDKRNVVCEWCHDEINENFEDITDFDLGTEIIQVCQECYGELRAEYGFAEENNWY